MPYYQIQTFFSWIDASAAAAAAATVNLNGIKTLLANGLSTNVPTLQSFY